MESDSFGGLCEVLPLGDQVTGGVVVGKANRVDFDGIHVNFRDPLDGFVPTSELAIPLGLTERDVVSIDETIEFVVLDDDNTPCPHRLSQRALWAGGRFGGNGVASSAGRKRWLSHKTGVGKSRAGYRLRSDAIEALCDLHAIEDPMTMCASGAWTGGVRTSDGCREFRGAILVASAHSRNRDHRPTLRAECSRTVRAMPQFEVMPPNVRAQVW